MPFSVTVLGSSAAVPANNRNLSSHVLNARESFFLIDCGEGTQFQLKRYHISPQRIRHIFISHLHGDHFFGLVGLLNTMHLQGRKEELHLYADARLEQILDLQAEVSQTVFRYPLVFHPLRMEAYDLLLEQEHITVHSFPLKHSIPACGFVFREKNPPRRITEARSYAYCSDTGYNEEIIPWIHGVKLLYHETTFMQAMASVAAEKLHSTAAEAAQIAVKAKVGKLLIGHFSARYEDITPLLEEAQAIFPETAAAVEGIKVDI